jgi:hypothetical protein
MCRGGACLLTKLAFFASGSDFELLFDFSPSSAAADPADPLELNWRRPAAQIRPVVKIRARGRRIE